MSKELRELRETIANYAVEYSVNEIPSLYFDNMVKTWHDMNLNGHDWDKSKAAAALLHTAITSNAIHISQLTPHGYKALKWAIDFQKKLDA